jgi:coenzyme F420-reducing hydrogenase beta subunit
MQATLDKTTSPLKPKTVLELINHEECTGCLACVSMCPFDALSSGSNQDGFYSPVLDESACKGCNICIKFCPVHATPANASKNDAPPVCNAFMADDATRFRASSGGAFPIIAKEIILKSGSVVGAAFNDDFSVSLCMINKLDDLPLLLKSKYVQSNAEGIYAKVHSVLKSSQTPLLFAGLPCQVAGLYAYLESKHFAIPEHLLTIDLVCAEAPSPKLWQRYLEECWGGPRNIENYDFRAKECGWNTSLKIVLKNGETQILPQAEDRDLWRKLSCRYLRTRDTCCKCHFATFPRQGDLTIGDFWQIGKYEGTLDDGKGTNVILVNNRKGEMLLEYLRKPEYRLAKTPVEWADNHNRLNRYKKSIIPISERDRFFYLAQRHSFKKAAIFALEKKYDVGIVGFWNNQNFGACLTNYALFRAVTDLGYEALMIDSPIWRGVSKPDVANFRKSPYPEYATTPFKNYASDLTDYNFTIDRFLVGSDQLFNDWLYRGAQKFADLHWVAEEKKRAAYAISFGGAYFDGTQETKAELARQLKKFEILSVREKSGMQLLRNCFDVDGTHVLDPVFLCDKKYYDELAEAGKPYVGKGGVMGYVFNQDKNAAAIITFFSKTVEIPVELNTIENQKGSTVEDWLASIRNAQFVITDSYHCLCFAVIFRKPFLVLVNNTATLERITSLLELLHEEKRLCRNLEEYENFWIGKSIFHCNWAQIDVILDSEMEKSRKVLEICAASPSAPAHERDAPIIPSSRQEKNQSGAAFSSNDEGRVKISGKEESVPGKLQDLHTSFCSKLSKAFNLFLSNKNHD